MDPKSIAFDRLGNPRILPHNDFYDIKLWRSYLFDQVIICSMKGVYVLFLRLDREKYIQVGKLGKLHFKKGFYAYIGSARGAGGFKRVTRHFNVASGMNSTRRWHIDYFLPHSDIILAALSPTPQDLECTISKSLSDFCGIPGFGCSDCNCTSHLFYSDVDFERIIIDTCNRITGNESIIIRPHI